MWTAQQIKFNWRHPVHEQMFYNFFLFCFHTTSNDGKQGNSYSVKMCVDVWLYRLPVFEISPTFRVFRMCVCVWFCLSVAQCSHSSEKAGNVIFLTSSHRYAEPMLSGNTLYNIAKRILLNIHSNRTDKIEQLFRRNEHMVLSRKFYFLIWFRSFSGRKFNFIDLCHTNDS